MEDFYSMKKKLGLLLSVLLVVPIILTGCGRDGKKLLEEAMKNTSDIKSQKIDFILSCEIEQSGISTSPRLDFSLASDQDSAHLNFSMDSLLSSLLFQSFTPVSEDLYVQNDQGTATIYAKDAQGSGYIKTTMPANDLGLDGLMKVDDFSVQASGFAALANISKSIKVIGTEEVNGVKCDVVNVTLDFEKISSFSDTLGKNLDDQQKILLNVFSECIDFKFYIGQDDVRIYSIRIGINNKLVSMLNQLFKQQGDSSINIKDMQIEGGYTVDYQNELEELPTNVQNAEALSNEDFESRCSLFQMMEQGTPTYDDYLPDDIYEDTDGFWEEDSLDADNYYDDYMGS